MPLERIFNKYWDFEELSKACIQINSLNTNELKSCYRINYKGVFELQSMVWKGDCGICYRSFNNREGRTIVDIGLMNYINTKDHKGNLEIPISIAISEFHCYLLYSNKLILISKDGNETVYHNDFMIGENLK